MANRFPREREKKSLPISLDNYKIAQIFSFLHWTNLNQLNGCTEINHSNTTSLIVQFILTKNCSDRFSSSPCSVYKKRYLSPPSAPVLRCLCSDNEDVAESFPKRCTPRLLLLTYTRLFSTRYSCTSSVLLARSTATMFPNFWSPFHTPCLRKVVCA